MKDIWFWTKWSPIRNIRTWKLNTDRKRKDSRSWKWYDFLLPRAQILIEQYYSNSSEQQLNSPVQQIDYQSLKWYLNKITWHWFFKANLFQVEYLRTEEQKQELGIFSWQTVETQLILILTKGVMSNEHIRWNNFIKSKIQIQIPLVQYSTSLNNFSKKNVQKW